MSYLSWKMWIRFVVFLLMANVAAVAHAQDNCSAQTLNGPFGFHVSGTNIVRQVGFAIVGRFEANGNGKFTGSGTESTGGKVGKISFSGTYTVNADCTGSAVFTFENGAVAHLDFVLVDGGSEALIIDSDDGTIESGAVKRISRHKSNK